MFNANSRPGLSEPAKRSFSTIVEDFSGQWRGRLIASGDALLSSEALACKVPNILSNDADLAKIAGICLFTANESVITAAKAARELVES